MILNKTRGFSLIELAVSLLILSIALIPVILLIGGKGSSKSTIQTKILTQEKGVANTLMESAIANTPEFMNLINKYHVLKQKNTSQKIETAIINYPKSKIYYKWTFKNLTYTGKNNKQALPDGNHLIDCSLALYNQESLKKNKTPTFEMGTKVLIQETEKTFEEPIIGIMILVDYTPSMAMSNWGWGHNPMNVDNIGLLDDVNAKDIPTFTKETSPNEVIKFVAEKCTPTSLYSNNIGYPYLRYKSTDDFVFGSNVDNPDTDINEKYLPDKLKDIATVGMYYAVPYKQILVNDTKVLQRIWKELERSVIGIPEGQDNSFLVNSAISKIEMVRSSLYLFIKEIEKGNAGNNKYFKIGILPFANITKKENLLKPESVDSKGQFKKLKTHIKSINRIGAPKKYTYSLTSNSNSTTDFEGALKMAHQALIEDKSLTDRIIIVITDWNPCIELPQITDINTTRVCIINVIKQLQEERKEIVKTWQEERKKDPNFEPDKNGELYKRFEEIESTISWLIKFLPDEEQLLSMGHQPYHPALDVNCKNETASLELNTLTRNVCKGKINGANNEKTDIYVLGLVDAIRPPSASILANMTTESENGEFLAAKDIKQIPQLFGYMVSELNRLLKLKQSERYSWNKKKR